MGLIFDIGCHCGNWLAANYNSEDNFIGIDGNSTLCLKTAERFRDSSNVKIMNAVVTDHAGDFVTFYVGSTDWASTISKKFMKDGRFANNIEWVARENIPTVSLDSLIAIWGIPDYVKIDVEGAELGVLRGLTKKIGMIAFEWNEEFKSETLECVSHLDSLGYNSFYLLYGDEYVFKPDEWYDYQQINSMINESLIADRHRDWGMIYAK